MGDLVLIVIGFYILYRLIFDFFVPVYRTTTHVKEQFKNMRQQAGQQNPGPQENAKKEEKTSKVGEYIDFEEIKK
ncbi:MAG TPA: hypothetical protein VKR32_20365 [Puia sp.]|nr:hypothetical protein [Puia sp.]